MGHLTSNKVKETLPETLDRVAKNRERVIVRRRGKDVAAIVPMEDLAALEEMEDRLDAEDFRVAKKRWQRGGLKTVPWDKLKAELGL
ncbi:MAG: type II toxin-antitoxin system Phd/YefM family antitoxin [Acidobacteria bacterium]|nr:type II toxin-antitoxin system Phd/YefM family antitoxin [Acidobacteriota bacterium]